jgi:hypothetical protein
MLRAAIGDIALRDDAGGDMLFESRFGRLIALGERVGDDRNRRPRTEPEGQNNRTTATIRARRMPADQRMKRFMTPNEKS